MEAHHISVGYVVMVFDNLLWERNGGDSRTDDFFREASVLHVYPELGLANVRFLHDGRISNGHFISGIKDIRSRPMR